MEAYYESGKNNPLLHPIHGVSLEDYAAAMYYLVAGIPVEKIIEIFNINSTIWNEVHLLWTKRMEEDAGLTVITSFSLFYNKAEQNKHFKTLNSLMSNLKNKKT